MEASIQVCPVKRCTFVCVYVASVCVCARMTAGGGGDPCNFHKRKCTLDTQQVAKGQEEEEEGGGTDLSMLVCIHLLQNKINSPLLFSVLSLKTRERT